MNNDNHTPAESKLLQAEDSISRLWDIVRRLTLDEQINILRRETGQSKESCEKAIKKHPYDIQAQIDHLRSNGPKF